MWARSGLVFVGRLNENLLIGAVLLLGGVLLARAGRVRARELATARLQAQLADARLAALAMELQPHFLFNALNSVATLVHSDAAAADRMITRLSLLLRRTLDAGREPLATLEEELEVVDLYLGIQQVRFGDRLVVERRIADETLQALVPRFILQPLVENALRHGLEPRRGSGTLRIEANREGERLRLAVCDDGVGMPAEGPQRVGTGLGNTRARLAHLYPGTHAVRIGPGDRGGSSVELRFPLELPGPAVIDQ
jgi:LytS/YehU family sensor histidine kinase